MTLSLNRSTSLKSSLLLIAPFFLWGTAMVAMKGVLPHTTPFFMAGIRLVPAGILVLMVAWFLKLPQPQGIKAWLWITIFALLDGAMFQGFLAGGLMKTGAGLGSVIIDSQPLAVALLSSWLFGEVIGIWGGIGLGFGILGISLIGLPQEWFEGFLNTEPVSLTFNSLELLNSGEFLMLLASLSMAAGTVSIRYVSRYADPIVATGWHMILGGIPLFFISGIWESNQWTEINLQGWLSLGYATIFGSAIAYGIFFYLASKGNLTSLSSLTFLTPVFALSFGNLFLNEILTSWQWFGVSLTLVSIYLINQRETFGKQWRYLRFKIWLFSKRILGKLSETIFSSY
ncbi:MAG: DMT family transporter [Crocosphaera sp.]|jgi:drug/metabolite transporter (DMT)-like permease